MQSFLSGGSTALTLFAPRRTGKTQFLVHDLAPTAEKQKCIVVYASFWQTTDTPVATLNHAVEGAGNGPGFWRRTGNAFSGMKPRIGLCSFGLLRPIWVGAVIEELKRSKAWVNPCLAVRH